MKKYLVFILLTALLSSCVLVKHPYNRYSTVVDFEKYTSQGFFITESNSVSFDYEPLGSLSAIIESGYEVIGTKGDQTDDVYYHTRSSNNKYGDYISATIDDVVEDLVFAAADVGADGLINLKTEYVSGTYDKYGNVLRPSMYIATGMAIKRK